MNRSYKIFTKVAILLSTFLLSTQLSGSEEVWPNTFTAESKGINPDLELCGELLVGLYESLVYSQRGGGVVLFFGSSGSGKSTTIAYLQGAQFKKQVIEVEDKKRPGKKKLQALETIEVAEVPLFTDIPYLTDIKMDVYLAKLYKDDENQFTYCDLEGVYRSSDTLGSINTRLINLFTPYLLVKMNRTQAIVLTMKYDAIGDPTFFRDELKALSDYFALDSAEEIAHFKQSIYILITAAPPLQGSYEERTEPRERQIDRIEHLFLSEYAALRNPRGDIRRAGNEEKLKKWFELFLQPSSEKDSDQPELNLNRFCFIDPTDAGESRAELQKALSTAQGIRPSSLRPFDTSTAYWLNQAMNQFSGTSLYAQALQEIWPTHFAFSGGVPQVTDAPAPPPSTDDSDFQIKVGRNQWIVGAILVMGIILFVYYLFTEEEVAATDQLTDERPALEEEGESK